MPDRPYVLATLEGYAVEGGFDRANEPATCYAPTIALGRHAGPGDAEGLWRDYEDVLTVAASIGLDGVRLGVEWARIEPRRDLFDLQALERYAQVIAFARSLDLRVSVCLVGGAWPSWLGLEAWLLPWVEPRVLIYARRALDELGEIDGVVPFADAKGLVEQGFLTGTAPPWRRAARHDVSSALEQMARIRTVLSEDSTIGPLLVNNPLTLGLDPDALAEALRTTSDEIHLRSLVKGVGPTQAPEGLLARHNGVWRVVPGTEILEVLG